MHTGDTVLLVRSSDSWTVKWVCLEPVIIMMCRNQNMTNGSHHCTSVCSTSVTTQVTIQETPTYQIHVMLNSKNKTTLVGDIYFKKFTTDKTTEDE